VRITRYSLIPDSEGAGRYRGGLGLCREYSFVDHEPLLTTLADRAKYPPLGLFGGGNGKLAQYQLISNGGIRSLPSKGTLEVKAGERVRVETCGGGGYGPAKEREPERVLEDVRDGKISLDRARQDYGVAINPATWTIDYNQTQGLRVPDQSSADSALVTPTLTT
jgi:N-methylhydantoinase B